jgi:hypothetical protein
MYPQNHVDLEPLASFSYWIINLHHQMMVLPCGSTNVNVRWYARHLTLPPPREEMNTSLDKIGIPDHGVKLISFKTMTPTQSTSTHGSSISPLHRIYKPMSRLARNWTTSTSSAWGLLLPLDLLYPSVIARILCFHGLQLELKTQEIFVLEYTRIVSALGLGHSLWLNIWVSSCPESSMLLYISRFYPCLHSFLN